jgi:hypothetical protein
LGFWENDSELLATPTACDVVFTEESDKQFPDLLEHEIPRIMAEGVVKQLKVINIDEYYR